MPAYLGKEDILSNPTSAASCPWCTMAAGRAPALAWRSQGKLPHSTSLALHPHYQLFSEPPACQPLWMTAGSQGTGKSLIVSGPGSSPLCPATSPQWGLFASLHKLLLFGTQHIESFPCAGHWTSMLPLILGTACVSGNNYPRTIDEETEAQADGSAAQGQGTGWWLSWCCNPGLPGPCA